MRKFQAKYRIFQALLTVVSLSLLLLMNYQTISMKVSRKNEEQLEKDPRLEQLQLLPADDFGTLIDLKDFKFILSPQQCSKGNDEPEAVVLITSSSRNFLARKTVRDTWGKSVSRVLIFFLLGGVENIEDQIKIDEEFQVGNIHRLT
jgi:hypothetical protein